MYLIQSEKQSGILYLWVADISLVSPALTPDNIKDNNSRSLGASQPMASLLYRNFHVCVCVLSRSVLSDSL